jgi:hypothetical protein
LEVSLNPWSWDAVIFTVKTVPEDAHRFAKGDAIDFGGGGKIQLKHSKMDFYVVTEHAEYPDVPQSQ